MALGENIDTLQAAPNNAMPSSSFSRNSFSKNTCVFITSTPPTCRTLLCGRAARRVESARGRAMRNTGAAAAEAHSILVARPAPDVTPARHSACTRRLTAVVVNSTIIRSCQGEIATLGNVQEKGMNSNLPISAHGFYRMRAAPKHVFSPAKTRSVRALLIGCVDTRSLRDSEVHISQYRSLWSEEMRLKETLNGRLCRAQLIESA